MNEQAFAQLEELHQSEGAAAAIDRLIETLRDGKQYHRLFDALLLKKKFELGIPVSQPTSFDDVPEQNQEEFKQCYVEAAREIGELLLSEQNIPEAWVYFRTLGEPEKVANALNEVDARREANEETEQLIQIALYEGANPVKGLEIMLRTHGTCNTITALDQQIQQLNSADRLKAAGLLVRELYDDLSQTLQSEVEQKLAMAPPGNSIRELMAGRDWLFEDGNYHIDVSHLSSVVRFARSFDPSSPELLKAIELAEYGSHLAEQFQYPGDPPFEDCYPAHIQFFKVLGDVDRDGGLAYFREKLDAAADPEDKQLIAYVLVDLLVRIERLDEALPLAEQYLQNVDQADFSFAQLCRQAGRLDTLRKVARENGDLVGYTAALVQENAGAVSA